ncbi:MAG: DNA topoisomerase (ATP-hydrolyzing) subunit A [bacterium]
MSTPGQTVRDKSVQEYLPDVYTEYAMSVITDRAIPDVRDGLKPVQRRILFSLWKQGLTPDDPHKKSARTVGEVLGKYHPHGDQAVYDALVRMGQPFSLRYPLVDGQGNFGSIDGDPAAAMRYTEARLSELATEFFPRLSPAGSGVPWQENFDGSEEEPVVLPVPFPNVLVNGTSGIAVGMSTDIPSHNITEVLEAAIHLIDHPNARYSTLMDKIDGPDYPTGGVIFAEEGELEELYRTGKGRFEIAGRCHTEKISPERGAIVIEELPYGVSKSRLIDKMVELAKSDDDPGISTVRDESDRQGLRIVVECRLKRSADVILNNLYKKTPLKTTQRVKMLVLNDGVPEIMSLKDMLNCYLDFMDEVLIRNTEKRKQEAEDRLHIVKGLLKALIDIDRVIEIVKQSETGPKASEALQHEFKMSEEQAEAVLDRRIRSLTGMQQMEIEQERDDLIESIEEYEEILSSEEKRGQILKDWFRDIRDEYGDERRTTIQREQLEIDVTDLREESPTTVLFYPNGYVRREKNHKDTEDIEPPPYKLIHTTSLEECLVFDRAGQVYSTLVSEIPDDARDAKGAPIQQINNNIESIAGIVPADTQEVLMFTRNGYVKRMKIEGDDDFDDIRPSGIKCIDFKEDDNEVVSVVRVRENCDPVAVARNGRGIRFDISDLRPLSRNARGVIAKKGEPLAGGVTASDDELLLLGGEDTCAAVDVSDIEPQNRGGKGRYIIKPSKGNELNYLGVSDYPLAAKDGDIVDFTSRSKIGGRGARESIDYFVVIEDWGDASS